MTDKEYYSDTKHITNSMLGYLTLHPKMYKENIERIERGEMEDEPDYYVFGRAVHAMLLEKDRFDKMFDVVDVKPPSNAVQNKFCDFMIAVEYVNESTKKLAYKMAYSTKSLKEEEITKRANELFNKNADYILKTRNKDDRATLTEKQYNTILNIESVAKRLKHISKAIYETPSNGVAFNEKVIFFKFNGIDMKSKIDRFVIDFDKKLIKLYDIKTSSVKYKDVNFKEKFMASFKNFKYKRQFGLYSVAVGNFFKAEYPSENLEEYTLEAYVIAIKSNFDNDIRLFGIPEPTIIEGIEDAKKLVEDLKFYNEHGFDMTVEAYKNEGIEILIDE